MTWPTHKVCTRAKNKQFLKLRRVLYLPVRGFKQWPGQETNTNKESPKYTRKTSDWTQQPDHHWVLFSSLYYCLCVCSEIPQLLFQVTLMMMMMAHSKHTCLTQMWTSFVSSSSSIKLWWLQMISSLYNYQEQSAASFLCHLYIFLPKLSVIIVFPWQRLR